MELISSFENSFLGNRWSIFKHTRSSLSAVSRGPLAILYSLRIFVINAIACIWVSMTLLTGIFTVAMVIPLGALIGISHFWLSKGPKYCHLPSALYLTLFGGILCNLLAGLALFSHKVGVSYLQVLTSLRFPEDLQMLSGVFIESLGFQDVFYYFLSIVAVIYFANLSCQCERFAGNLIEIAFPGGRTYRVGVSALNGLLTQNKITKFKRSDGWVTVGKDPLRTGEKAASYFGAERRSAT